MQLFIAAITLGFLGSFHCIGMCGPIALALPVHNKTLLQKTIAIILYNLGRVITYALLGMLFGFIGSSFKLFGLQQALSITLGVIILVMVFFPKVVSSNNKSSQLFYSFFYKLKTKISLQFKNSSFQSLFLIGLLNGLLPCGLVYIAIAGAIASNSILNGMLFMSAFGLGTIPFMFSVTFYSNLISLNVRNTIRKAMPAFIVVMALLLIVRGLNLGIPYLSPQLESNANKISCCDKPTIKCSPKNNH